jgi:hypothetical protein
MAQADLECYDENGNVTLTAATLFGRVLGSLSTGTANGSAYFPGLTTSGAEHWYMSSISGLPGNNLVCIPRISIANDTVTWTFVDYAISSNGNLAPRVSSNIILGTD